MSRSRRCRRRHGLRPGSRAPRGRPQTPRCPPGTGCRTSRSRRCCRTRGRRPGRARTPAHRPAPCNPGARTGRSHCARRACASGASARTPRAAAQAGVPVSMRDCPDTKTERQRASARSLPVKVRRAHACQPTLLADRGTAQGVACLHMLGERAPRLAAHRCCTWTTWIRRSWRCNWIRWRTNTGSERPHKPRLQLEHKALAGAVVPRRHAPSLRGEAAKHGAPPIAHHEHAGAPVLRRAPTHRGPATVRQGRRITLQGDVRKLALNCAGCFVQQAMQAVDRVSSTCTIDAELGLLRAGRPSTARQAQLHAGTRRPAAQAVLLVV